MASDTYGVQAAKSGPSLKDWLFQHLKVHSELVQLKEDMIIIMIIAKSPFVYKSTFMDII